MRLLKYGFFLATLALFSPAAQAQELAPPITYAEPYDAEVQGYANEVRGVWITNVDSDLLTSRESIAEGMDYLASRGINVVFPVVWNKAYTLYPSDVMVELFGEGRRQDPAYTSQGRDPLQEVIEEAHLRGMEVMPWFEYGFAASFSQDGGFLIQQKPDWAAIGTDGNIVTKNGFDWMNGLHPEVQQFMIDLVTEVAEKYDIDGIQGDDRLPAMPVEAGYSPTTRALYAADHGGAQPPSSSSNRAFQEWRADKLTEFLGDLYRAVKEIDEDIVVSLSPSIFPFSFSQYLQDWPEWIDRGYVDLIHPQAYRRSFASYRALAQFMPGAQVPRDSVRLILSPGVLSKAGSTLMTPSNAVAIAEWNRENDFAGEVWFFYEGMRERNQFLGDSLRKYVYTRPAILPIRDQIWRPQPKIAHENDPSVSREGAWVFNRDAPGYRGGVLEGTQSGSARATYRLDLPGAGTFELYAYALTGYDGTGEFTIENDNGAQTVALDLSEVATPGWKHLGTFPLSSSATVELNVTGSGTFAADALAATVNRKLTEALFVRVPASTAQPGTPVATALALTAYPNPASRTTTLAFDLSHASSASISLYDALGREVRSLPARSYAAGSHEASLSLGALAPGVYLARIETPSGMATQRVVVMR